MRFLPIFFFLLATTSPAAVILSNLPPGNAQRSFASNEWLALRIQMGPTSFTLDSIDLRISNNESAVRTLDVAFYSNSGTNLPGTLLQTFNTVAIAANQSASNINLSPTSVFQLNASTTYWMRVQSLEPSPAFLFWVGDAGAVATNSNATADLMVRSFSQGATWSALNTAPQGFALNGSPAAAAIQSVPEPSTLLLSLSAGALFLLRKRR
jgi:hypothetical protein